MEIGSKIFWRVKGTTEYFVGYVCEFKGEMNRIGSYINDSHGRWFSSRDIEYKEIK